MSRESHTVAALLLILLPTVIVGGVSILSLILHEPGYLENELRQDLWRAGHAHAGVMLILALVMLRYVDEAYLSPGWRWVARLAAPVTAILMPVAFFFSVLRPDATEPNAVIYLAYVGAAVLTVGLITLDVGLLRRPRI